MYENMTCKEIQQIQINDDLTKCYDGHYIIEVVTFDGTTKEKYKYNSQERNNAYLHYYRLKTAYNQIYNVLFYIRFQICT